MGVEVTVLNLYKLEREEMKMAVGLKSKNSINKRVSQLEDRKWIKRLPGKARSIQIIK